MTGNYMNRGARGNAFGFSLRSLLNMADTKSGKTRGYTLLHFVVATIDTAPVLKSARLLATELAIVHEACKVWGGC
jgi:hypothetical protein